MVLVPIQLKKHKIDGKTVLITGAGNGIGQIMARLFAQEGARVIAVDIFEKGLEKTVNDVKTSVPEAKIITKVCDITNRQLVNKMAKELKDSLEGGYVNILVNNAGIVSGKPLLELQEREILRTMNVNAISHFWTCQAFLPDMIKEKDGHIVTIASIAGLSSAPRLTDYCASKFASVGFEEALRLEIEAEGYEGVHSTLIAPFFISTGLFEGVKSTLPLLEPEFVARKIVNAVLTRQPVLMIPKFMYILYFLKSFLPVSALYEIIRTLKADIAMRTFVGRHEKTN